MNRLVRSMGWVAGLLAAACLAGALGEAGAADSSASGAAKEKKKVVLIAGKPSHAYGAHEHAAGFRLLARRLNESGLPIEAVVVTGGWPEDSAVLEDADAIVMFSDGGNRHMVNDHLEELDRLASRGVGIGAIHYAVEVPKNRSGSYFLDWMGGYFEMGWSVNPFWTAEFKEIPEHPVTRGVKPFSIHDEWYFHMRFRENMDRVTPILSAVPSPETMSRPDGPHSGNPTVRQKVASGEPQHMMWVIDRPDGGRGFGFTGGHVHWNWGHDQVRKLVLNAICWLAKVEVPSDGIASETPTIEELTTNLDKKPPKNFRRETVEELLRTWKDAS